MVIIEILFALVTIPLLIAIVFFNVESVFQNKTLEIRTIIYVVYFLFSVLWLTLLKYIKIENKKIKQELFSSIQFIFHICVLALPAILLVHYFIIWKWWWTSLYFRAYGKVAFLYLVLALSISPIVSFVKNKKISDTLILMRKVLWILSFLFFLRHGIEYFNTEYIFAIKHTPAIGYLDYVWQNLLIRNDALTWVIAWILMLVLWITSNKLSINLLGATWKKVQSIAYPAFLIAIIHVAFTSRFNAFYVALILWLIYIRTISYLQNSNVQKWWLTTKYICIPCGYIYDEALWDPDWWLAPWTKFDEIPDGRFCPVCGAKKSSFEPYYDIQEKKSEWYVAKISGYVMLTKDVLELTLTLDGQLSILPWQHLSISLRDFDWEFIRRYSVVENSWSSIKLWIKIKETGRGGRTLKNLKIWDNVKINAIYWNFILKNTSNGKIFVATWTGISPLYNMILRNTFSEDNMLFWWVAMKEDLFYMEELNRFKNLKLEIFLSKEDIKPYHYGRVDTSMYDFPLDSEFYLCGNAAMVEEQSNLLKWRWYENIYVEIF